MTLDEINELWSKDSKVTPISVGDASVEVAKIQQKYIQYHSHERLVLKKYKTDYNVLLRAKYEYYNGTLAEEELKERGWAPQMMRILKADILMYINADKDIVALTLKIGMQEEKVFVLASAIKSLDNRHWNLKNFIEITKFNHGA